MSSEIPDNCFIRACTDKLYLEQFDVARIQVFNSLIGLVNLEIKSQIPNIESRNSNESRILNFESQMSLLGFRIIGYLPALK